MNKIKKKLKKYNALENYNKYIKEIVQLKDEISKNKNRFSPEILQSIYL